MRNATRHTNQILLFLMITSAPVAAQPLVWQQAQVSGQRSDEIEAWSFARSSLGDLYAAANNEGVFHSSDNGEHWTWIGLRDEEVLAVAVDTGDNVLAGSMNSRGVFRTQDNGQVWEQIGLDGMDVGSLEIGSLGEIFATAGSGFPDVVYRYEAGGNAWTPASSGLDAGLIWRLHALEGGVLLAATIRGIYRSADAGDNWSRVAFADTSVLSLATTSQGVVYAGATTGVYHSDDDGQSWNAIWATGEDAAVLSLAARSDGDVFAGLQLYGKSNGGVYRSADAGLSWELAGLDGFEVRALTLDVQENAVLGTTDSPFNGIFVERQTVVEVCPFSQYYLTAQAQVDAFPSGCSEVSGRLAIGPSTDITDLSPLSTLSIVGGDLSFIGNAALTDVSGLSILTSVGGGLEIQDNPVLTAIDDLSGISSIVGAVRISNNAELAHLSGLSGITSVGADLTVEVNDALTDLSGLAELMSVGGDVYIGYNSALASFNGLSGLTSVGGSLLISDNSALENLNGLSALSSVGGNLSVIFNERLAECSCGLYGVLSAGGVTGLVEMFSNAPTGDCNNDGGDLLANACDVGTDVERTENNVRSEFVLRDNYPNPFSPTTTIAYDLPRLSVATLTVYDVLGRELRVLSSDTERSGTQSVTFDATGLPSGVYFYRLRAGDFVQTKRMMVVK